MPTSTIRSEELTSHKDPLAVMALTKTHTLPILDCCFSPDTNQILTGGEDKKVVLWNLPSTDTQLHDDTINDENKLSCYRLSGHDSPVMAVAMHKGLILGASKSGEVKLWRLECPISTSSIFSSGPQFFKRPSNDPFTYNCHTRIIHSACFSRTAENFATGSDDLSVKIWSTEGRNKLVVSFLEAHENWVKCVRYNKTNDKLLASCGDDGRICIWDARSTKRKLPEITIKSKRRRQFNCLDWHPIFTHNLVTGSQDSSCIVWDMRNKKEHQMYIEHNGSVNSVAFNSTGSLLLSGSNDQTSKIFDVTEGYALFSLLSHNAPITSVCFSATDDLFATGSIDKTVTVWKRNFDMVALVRAGSGQESNHTSREYSGDSGVLNNRGEFFRQ